jgi:hypothetical protein
VSINTITGNTLLTSGSFPPVRAASTGSPLNPSTGGLLVVDGVQLVAGDRVLCKDETSAVNNGIYAANTGPWVRTTDATNNQQFFSGMAVTVGLGNVNAGLTFICTSTDDPVIVGTSLITFAAQSIVATATQQATSITSLGIGTGSKTFTIPAGKAFAVNQWVIVQETSNATNQMLGQITAYSGTSLTMNVVATGGSGTHADWTIVLTNSPAAAGYQPPVGSGNVTGPGSSTAGHMATFADGTGKVLQDGGAPVGAANTITPSMLAAAAISLGATMLNGTISVSVGSNALTIAVKTLAGNDPSSSDPVWFVFRSATASSGSYSVIEVTAALSTTVPASSTLGFANGTPGRIWLVAVNNGGTVSLAVINCLTLSSGVPTAIFPLTGIQGPIASITAYGGGANSAGTFYGASSLSNVPYSVLGFLTWETGGTLATAGTWNLTPSRIELYRPGVPLPGSIVQTVNSTTTTQGSTTSATFQALISGQTLTITPASSANAIKAEASGGFNTTATTTAFLQMSRGAVNNTGLFGSAIFVNCTNAQGETGSMAGYDFPAASPLNSVTYAVQGKTSTGTLTYPNSANGANAIMVLTEIIA